MLARIAGLVIGAASLASEPAQAQTVAKVGPIGTAHPFPLWYEDASLGFGVAGGLRLEPCLTTGTNPLLCGFVAGTPGLDNNPPFDPTQPIVFPTNFPSEVFYSSVVADVPLSGVTKGFQVVLRVEGTFNQKLITGQFISTQPMTFTRIRFVQLPAANVLPNQTYTVTFPYGVQTLTSDAQGNLFPKRAATIDVPLGFIFGGQIPPPDFFNDPTNTYTTFLSSTATSPPGFVGDGASIGPITGSPLGTNFLRIEGPGIPSTCAGGAIANCLETPNFTVTGKLYSPGAVVADRFQVSGLAAGIAGTAQSVTVRAVDANGNLDTTYAGTVHFTSTDPAALLPADALLPGGFGTFSVTPRTAGSFQVTIAQTPAPAPPITGTSATVAISGGAPKTLALTSGGAQTGAVGTQLLPFSVKVSDQLGNGLPGITVQFAAPAGASVTPSTATTNAGGVATATATLGTTPGTETFTAVTTGIASLAIPATATAGAPTQLAIGGLLATVAAGTGAAYTLTALDQFGNVATGFSGVVTFSTDDPLGVVNPASVSLASGAASGLSVTFKTAGSRHLNAATGTVSTSAALTVTAGTPASVTQTGGAGQTGAAGAALPAPFVVKVQDQFGNPASGVTVSFSTSAGGAISPASAVTAADGTASATGLLGPVPGVQLFAAAVSGLAPLALPATAAPASAARLQVTGMPGVLAAGTSATITITALDQFGNVATGFNQTVLVSTDDPQGGAVIQASCSSGVATNVALAFKTAGTRTLLVNAAAAQSASVAVTVTAGAPSKIQIVTSPASGGAGTAAAPIVVAVADAFGNAVANAPVSFIAATAGGAITPASATTDANGQATATPTLGSAAGVYDFIATVGSAPGVTVHVATGATGAAASGASGAASSGGGCGSSGGGLELSGLLGAALLLLRRRACRA